MKGYHLPETDEEEEESIVAGPTENESTLTEKTEWREQM
jgi:hypothetical protein